MFLKDRARAISPDRRSHIQLAVYPANSRRPASPKSTVTVCIWANKERPGSHFPFPTSGVFDTSSSQTLYLFVDVKTPGPTTWPAVVKALEPLRNASYLTTFNGTGVTPGPVTVIGTGNTPLDQVQPVQRRDYFWDAQIPALATSQANITRNVSPIASTSFAAVFGDVRNQTLNATQLSTLRSQVATAHAR
ncbi:hypothetical protein LTR39_002230, partial [Cryomyces antarcticus]